MSVYMKSLPHPPACNSLSKLYTAPHCRRVLDSSSRSRYANPTLTTFTKPSVLRAARESRSLTSQVKCQTRSSGWPRAGRTATLEAARGHLVAPKVGGVTLRSVVGLGHLLVTPGERSLGSSQLSSKGRMSL